MSSRKSDKPERFLDLVRSGLAACSVENTRVLVAVSGGPDSVALLRALFKVRETAGIQLHVGHVNHRLRERCSDADAEWVRQLSQTLEVPCDIQTVEVVPGSESGESLEESARNMRYDLLTATAEEIKCSAIAVAHTADDQAETILHHLVRGTGITGLQGIPRTRWLSDSVRLVRPLLDVSRAQIEAWLSAIGQDTRVDASNSDTTLTRNRIRHSLLPLLAGEFNPQIHRVLGTLAIQAGELADFVGAQAESLVRDIQVTAMPDSLRIDCDVFRDQPIVLVREALRRIWQDQEWPQKRMGFREWQRLAEIAIDGGAVSLPERIDARRRGSLLVLARSHDTPPLIRKRLRQAIFGPELENEPDNGSACVKGRS